MKIEIPFCVSDMVWQINWFLSVIFRNNPKNQTVLGFTFSPRKIRTSRNKKGLRFWMWSDGTYINIIPKKDGLILELKTKRTDKPGWVRFSVPIWDILQAEKNVLDGIKEEDSTQKNAREKQDLCLSLIQQAISGA
jgi:hypothetical protein